MTTDFDTTVRLAILDGFLAGGLPTVASIARELGVQEDRVGETFDRLAAGRAIVLQPGTRELLMVAPFAGARTAFVVREGDRSHYANCIWDALGISAMLSGAGRASTVGIDTRCADCAAPLRLNVEDGRVTADPPEAVVHFAVPAARWWADIAFT